jgi:hypothetical protein
MMKPPRSKSVASCHSAPLGPHASRESLSAPCFPRFNTRTTEPGTEWCRAGHLSDLRVGALLTTEDAEGGWRRHAALWHVCDLAIKAIGAADACAIARGSASIRSGENRTLRKARNLRYPLKGVSSRPDTEPYTLSGLSVCSHPLSLGPGSCLQAARFLLDNVSRRVYTCS